jgi:hypothetical protein
MAKIKICNCGCGAEFIPTKLGQKQVNQSHYITWLINTPEGQKKQAEAKEKAKKIIAKKEAKNKSAIEWQQKANDNWLKFKREQKKETRSYQQELILTKNVFQSWIRLRDKYRDECISCRKKLAANEKVNASHYFKAELFSGVIFHPFNLWKSCITCNMFNDGNLAQYTPYLIEEIGQIQFDRLKLIANKTKEFTYDRTWLIDFRKKVNKLIKLDNTYSQEIIKELEKIGLH